MSQSNAGRPPYEPSEEHRETVIRYTAVGIPQADIAKILQIDVKTLTKYYRDEIDTAVAQANGEVGGALYSKAIAGDTTAMIWWTKTRMKWAEKKEVDLSGQVVSVNTKEMSLEDAQRVLADKLKDLES